MTPKALGASAGVALVVFAVFAALLYITLSRTTNSAERGGYQSTSHAIKPMLVGIGN